MFKPRGYTAVFLSLLLKILCISLFLPVCLVCSDCSLPVKAFLYQIPALKVSEQSSKFLNCRGLCLPLLLPVQRVSTKSNGIVSSGERKCYSGVSVGGCTSVGVLHVWFLQYLSQVSSCQTVLQQSVKHLQRNLWEAIKILAMSLAGKWRSVGWHVPPN